MPIYLTCSLLAATAGMTLAWMLCRCGEKEKKPDWLPAALLAVLAIPLGGQTALSFFGLSFRPWLGSALLAAVGILAAALCLKTTAVLMRGEQNRPARWLAALCCCAALACGGLAGSVFFALSLKDEAAGEWSGRRVVMVHAHFQDPYYYEYYPYHGPVVMGRLLGRSDEAWGEAYWMY